MAVGFSKPDFEYEYDLETEKANFDKFFVDPARGIPPKQPDELDLATWNIANLGVQKRRPHDLALIAHILSHFDIIAIQEINEKLDHFRSIMEMLSEQKYAMMITDATGNQERLGVVYRTDRLQPRQLFGELDYNPNGSVVDGKYVVPPKTQKFKVDGEDIETLFYGFNRNPFMSTWRVLGDSTITFMLVTAHLFFGKKQPKDPRFRNRVAEAFFLAQWASSQRRKGSDKVYESNIILLGDMNVPKMERSDPVFAALLRRGMLATKYSTEAGTTIKEFNSYDQVVFTKETSNIVKIVNQRAVVVDFDNFVFPDLWQQVEAGTRTKTDFKRWTKFAVSDHRPVLVRLKV